MIDKLIYEWLKENGYEVGDFRDLLFYLIVLIFLGTVWSFHQYWQAKEKRRASRESERNSRQMRSFEDDCLNDVNRYNEED